MNVMNLSFGKLIEVKKDNKSQNAFVNPLHIQSVLVKENSYETRLAGSREDTSLSETEYKALSGELIRLKEIGSKKNILPMFEMPEANIYLNPNEVESIELSVNKPDAYDKKTPYTQIFLNEGRRCTISTPKYKKDFLQKLKEEDSFSNLLKIGDDTYVNPDKVVSVGPNYYQGKKCFTKVSLAGGNPLYLDSESKAEIAEKINKKLD